MKQIIILFLVFLLIVACKQKGSNYNGFEIDGTIAGYDSSYVMLKKLIDSDLSTIDSAYVLNGKFKLDGELGMPEMCYLEFGDMKHLAKIFLENSKISFYSNYDSLETALITGSKAHYEFMSYEDEIHPFENKMADLYQQYKAASDQRNMLLMGQIDSTREALNKDMDTFIENFIETHKSSAVSPYILSKISSNISVSELDSILGILDKSLDESIYTLELKEKLRIFGNVEIGKEAPDFEANDTSGANISLSLFNGKIVLINFWAAWNSPGRIENHSLLKLYEEYNKNGFEILGVSLDKNKEQWKKAIQEDNLVWTQVSDLKFWKSNIAKLYGISKIPNNVLIDKEGIIIGKNLKPDELRNQLKELLH
jgi:peroxiredoxin